MFRFCPRAATSIAGLWLLALGAQQATAAAVDYDALEFRHGISQIPNYDLKYPQDFARLEYVNPDAPKGGTLALSYTYSLFSATPTSKPPGFGLSYDYLLERAGDELSGFYGSLAESVATERRFRRSNRISTATRGPLARWDADYCDGRQILAGHVPPRLYGFGMGRGS